MIGSTIGLRTIRGFGAGLRPHVRACVLDGKDKIKLTKSDLKSGGQHHVIPLGWVAKVDAHVHLNKSAKDVMAQWQAAA
jgi:hypothetical protein